MCGSVERGGVVVVVRACGVWWCGCVVVWWFGGVEILKCEVCERGGVEMWRCGEVAVWCVGL